MTIFRKIGLACAIGVTATLVACGGSSSGGSAVIPTTGDSISGTAAAPGGAVAQFRERGLFEIAADFIITPAMADVIGLQPVTGAAVELVRVDDNGVQIGDVLATTTTSITGDYTLTLPQGVSLAGNLLVRITGTGGTQMRAQVVQQSVNITPVSEFVLQRYIENGADLDNLAIDDVVKLNGRVAEFDLTAGADMADMLGLLEGELGDFVDNSIAASTAPSGDVSAIAGAYRSTAFALGLHDGDANPYGTVTTDIWQADFTFTDAGNGVLGITWASEEGLESHLSGDEASASFYSSAYSDSGSETFPATYSSENGGAITVLGDFEEDIDPNIDSGTPTCCGWRWLPSTYRLQQAPSRGLFFLISEDAGVRYLLTDTNGDSIPDAVNPGAREGDEVERALEIFARKPSGMTNADLAGNFGRVWLGTALSTSSGPGISVETETNIINFKGDGTLDAGEASWHQLTRSAYNIEPYAAETNLPITLAADGGISSVGGQPVDGFINDTFDFIALADAEGTDGGLTSKTLMLKLGSGTPTVSGNVYRVMALDIVLSGNEIELVNSRFASTLTMSSESAGNLSVKMSTVHKDNLGANLLVANEDTQTFTTTATVGSGGATSLTINDGEGVETLDGFFNADASLGIFRSNYKPTGSTNPDAQGLTVLVKIN